MNHEELTALRDLIDLVLRLPDRVRTEAAKWLAPEGAQTRGNGLDRHPPRTAPTPTSSPKAKVKPNFEAVRRPKLTEARTAEQKLLRAMEDNPGLSIVALANAADASRSTT
jgi:hypothetical protein